jgi:hypothetical protein
MSRYGHMPTGQLELSLMALARWARAYAAAGPKLIEDQFHQEIDELLDEHRRRTGGAAAANASPGGPE